MKHSESARSHSGHLMIDIRTAAGRHGGQIAMLPYAMPVMVENRQCHIARDSGGAGDDVAAARWLVDICPGIPLHASRGILPDSCGLPALEGLTTLRDAAAGAGAIPLVVEPRVPADVVLDHSLQVDRFGIPTAATSPARRIATRRPISASSRSTLPRARAAPSATALVGSFSNFTAAAPEETSFDRIQARDAPA